MFKTSQNVNFKPCITIIELKMKLKRLKPLRFYIVRETTDVNEVRSISKLHFVSNTCNYSPVMASIMCPKGQHENGKAIEKSLCLVCLPVYEYIVPDLGGWTVSISRSSIGY